MSYMCPAGGALPVPYMCPAGALHVPYMCPACVLHVSCKHKKQRRPFKRTPSDFCLEDIALFYILFYIIFSTTVSTINTPATHFVASARRASRDFALFFDKYVSFAPVNADSPEFLPD